MCGIAGIVRKGNQDIKPELTESVNILSHRGPDDSGIWYGQTIVNNQTYTVGLGHVRLSILDLSPKGHQPMIGKGGAVIVLNGEIYNYLEIREELKLSGYEFVTGTDTEVVLAAYSEWGQCCVDRFIGMWAFAIWDGNQLFLSRDRLGKKPFYYYHDQNTGFFAFASEIKGLNHIPEVPWKPNEKVVYRYLAFAETERNGETFFGEIHELPAGTSILFCPGDTQLEVSHYWFLTAQSIDVDEIEAIRTTSDLLFDSLRLRLRSDTPLGLSLSGGLDSSLLLAMMNELGCKNVSAFSSGYSEAGYSETNYLHIAEKNLSCRLNATNTDVSYFKKILNH